MLVTRCVASWVEGRFVLLPAWLVHVIALSLLEALLGMTATSNLTQCLRTSEAMFGPQWFLKQRQSSGVLLLNLGSVFRTSFRRHNCRMPKLKSDRRDHWARS